jgi:hypothetical protein
MPSGSTGAREDAPRRSAAGTGGLDREIAPPRA